MALAWIKLIWYCKHHQTIEWLFYHEPSVPRSYNWHLALTLTVLQHLISKDKSLGKQEVMDFMFPAVETVV